MTRRAELLALKATVEALSGPSREVDAELWWALEPNRALFVYNNGQPGSPTYPARLPKRGLGRLAVETQSPRLTSSLDAVEALAAATLPADTHWTIFNAWPFLEKNGVVRRGPAAFVEPTGRRSTNATPGATTALALLAAVLAAIAEQETEDADA